MDSCKQTLNQLEAEKLELTENLRLIATKVENQMLFSRHVLSGIYKKLQEAETKRRQSKEMLEIMGLKQEANELNLAAFEQKSKEVRKKIILILQEESNLEGAEEKLLLKEKAIQEEYRKLEDKLKANTPFKRLREENHFNFSMKKQKFK